MNYNSIQEILSADINNMRALRENDRKVTGTDKIPSTSWLTINNESIPTYFRASSSYAALYFDEYLESKELVIGGSGDCSLYSLYREEGTLYGYYKFLKIRWSGFSDYMNETEGTKLEFDVILWDTGDISVHMVSKKFIQCELIIYKKTYPYENDFTPDVTFKKTENGFSIVEGIVDLPKPPYHLIRSGSSYYSITNGILNNIEVSELTSDIFLNLNIRTVPSLSLLKDLANPEILCWHEDNDKQLDTGLIVTGYPLLPQMVQFSSQDMANYTGIANVECPIAVETLFTISIDEGQSWKYYNEGTWVDAIVNSDGMTADTLSSIQAEEWAELITESTPSYKFRCALTAKESRLGKIYVKYI